MNKILLFSAAVSLAGVLFAQPIVVQNDCLNSNTSNMPKFAEAGAVMDANFTNCWYSSFGRSAPRVAKKDLVCEFSAPEKIAVSGEAMTKSYWIYRSVVWIGKEEGVTDVKVPTAEAPDIPYLLDFATGDAELIPAEKIAIEGDKTVFKGMPVKKSTVAIVRRISIMFENERMRDWKFSVKVVPEDKILFDIGEKPELEITLTDKDGNPVKERGVRALINWYRTHEDYKKEFVDFTNGPVVRRSMSLDKPGCITAEVSLKVVGNRNDQMSPQREIPDPNAKKADAGNGSLGADGKNNAVKMVKEDYARPVGCVFDWRNIKPGRPAPKDIDAFWDKLIEEDKALPFEVKQRKYIKTTDQGVDVFEVVFNSLGGDVHAQMSIPQGAKEGKKYPIWVIYQAYGVAKWWTWTWGHAITIAPNSHSIDNQGTGDYYKKLSAKGGPLFNYGFDTNENAKVETCLFRNMLLRDMRALRYMMEKEAWDGKTVYSDYGSSQGGYQLSAMMGLVPELGTTEHFCPWMIDLGGSQCHWRPKWGEGVQYCDPINLIHRMKPFDLQGKRKKTVINAGVIDIACPVDGVLAFVNELPKEVDYTVRLLQNRGHNVNPGNKNKLYRVEIERKDGGEPAVKLIADPRCYIE